MDDERYTTLRDCLTLLDSHLRLLSESDNKLYPKKGCEAAWDYYNRRYAVVQQMMQEVRYGKT